MNNLNSGSILSIRSPRDADLFNDDLIRIARNVLQVEVAGLNQLLKIFDTDFGQAVARAVQIISGSQQQGGRVIVTGIGKSGHIARKIASTLASTGTLSYFVHPGEASHGDLGMIGRNDIVLALSWSGEATELSDIIAYTRRFGVSLIAITARSDSALATAADIVLLLPLMPEACPHGMAPTTSSLMQLALGDMLAITMLSIRGFTSQDFGLFHPGGKLGSKLRKVGDIMHGRDAMPTVYTETLLSDAIVEMTSKRFGITGVLDRLGYLVGVVTDGDLRRSFSVGFTDCRVADIMSLTPRTISQSTFAAEALAVIQREKVTALFVTLDHKPVGIVHIHDLLRSGVI